MVDVFSVRMAVRGYELNSVGHVSHHVFHLYAEHARLELLRIAGCPLDRLLARGVGPALLETRTVFRRELLLNDEITVTCTPHFDDGTTFRLDSEIRFVDSGDLVAVVDCTFGFVDLRTRQILREPRQIVRELAANPAILLGDGAGRSAAAGGR